MSTPDMHHEPFLSPQPFSRRKTSDTEYVAQIAKSLQWWDRWRWFAILFHVAILAVVIWLGFSVVEIVQKFQGLWGKQNQNQNPMPEAVVLIGITLGLKLGFFFHSSLMGVLNALSGFRTERLLVQSFKDCDGPTMFSDDHISPYPATEIKAFRSCPVTADVIRLKIMKTLPRSLFCIAILACVGCDGKRSTPQHSGVVFAHVDSIDSGTGVSTVLTKFGDFDSGFDYGDTETIDWDVTIRWRFLKSNDSVDSYHLSWVFTPASGTPVSGSSDVAYDGSTRAVVPINKQLTVTIDPEFDKAGG